MKTGIVMQIEKEHLTLLTPEGEFLRAKKQDKAYSLGEEISFFPIEGSKPSNFSPFKINRWQRVVWVPVAILCIFFGSFISLYQSNKAYAYMSIDVNPSIELTLNKKMRVVELKAFNKDGSLAPLVDHPLAEIYSPGYSRSETFFNDGNLTFTWNVPHVKGLTLRTLGDFAFTMNPAKTFNVLATQYNTDGTIYPTPKPSLSQSTSNTKAYNAEFQADYSRSFNKHTVGGTFVSVVRGGNKVPNMLL